MPISIRSVPPGRGWQWIVEAFALFRKNPLIWLVLNLILVAIGWVLGKVPVAGSYMLYLLAPIFLAGIMVACRDLESGGDIEIGHLFRGFRQSTSQLVTVGGVHLVGQVAISGLMLGIGGPEFQEIAQGRPMEDPAAVSPETRNRILLALLVGLSLYLPLALAVWFSPALVLLGNQQGFRAIVFSLIAGVRNILPFLVYSLVSSVLLVLAVIPFGIGLVLWLPVMVLTMYTSYRDVFVAAAPAAQTKA
jgi:uncharacterized membrane protein